MEVLVKKLKAENVEMLLSLFEYKRPKIELIKIANDINSGNIDVFVLLKNHKTIGEIRVRYKNGEADEVIEGKRAYLFAFKIATKHQNKGYGTILLEEVIKTCKRAGYTEFTIGVETGNKIAKLMYFKQGFNTVIAHKSEIYEDMKYEYDLLYMRVENCNY